MRDSGYSVDPQLIIDRLAQALAAAHVQVAQYGALADQLLAERQAEKLTHLDDAEKS